MRNAPRLLFLFTLTLATLVAPLSAQKRPIDHDDYDKWPSLRSMAYSPDGSWMAYVVRPGWGDGVMHVRQVDGEKRFRHARGTSPKFSANGRYVIFSIKKSVEEEYRKKLDRLSMAGKEGAKALEAEAEKSAQEEAKQAAERRAQMMARFSRGRRGRGGRGGGSSTSGGSGELAIMDLTTGKVERIGKTRSFRVIKDGELLVYHRSAPEKKAPGAAPAGKPAPKSAPKSAPKTTPKSGAKSAAAETARRSRGGRGSGRRGRRGTGLRGGAARRSRGGSLGSGASSGGTQLIVRHLATGKETRFANVGRYQTVAKDAWLLLTREAPAEPAREVDTAKAGTAKGGAAQNSNAEKKRRVKSGLFAVRVADLWTFGLIDGPGSFAGFTTDRDNKKLVFTSDVTDRRAAERKREAAANKKAAKNAAKKAAKKAAAQKVTAKKSTAKRTAKSAVEKSGTSEVTKPEAAKPKARQEIFQWEFDDREPRRLVTAETKGIPAGATIQSSGLTFSGDGSVLTFKIRVKPRPEIPKILPEEKVVVDIWNSKDGTIQSMQAKRRGSDEETRTCAWHAVDGRLIVLGTKEIPSVRLLTGNGNRALATDSKPYEKLVTWDGRYSDVYLVNTSNGSRRKLVTKLRGRTSSSPSGKYVLYFGQDYQWYAIDVSTRKQRCLTSGLGVSFQNVLDDHPQPASAYGIAGWTAGDAQVLIHDRYDLWKIDMKSGEAACVTDGFGRENRIVLRYTPFDFEGDDDDLSAEERLYVPEKILLSAKDDTTKARGYYADTVSGSGPPEKLVMLDRAIGRLTRAKKADRLFFTLSTFAEFPDVWVSDLGFRGRRKLTDACPIQREVRWGASEIVTWTNTDGEKLQGILVKPDGFDPKRKYPMMVYFYERNADNVHRYVRPSAGTSPNAAYYVSNGYLWFVPDIIYTIGYPGESAEKCVLSGVQSLIAKGFVDRKAIGAAGHSWGGYQTAHLVTRTNLFAAVESGAPVSDMFSAYGGIRYQSGMSRQFQYERTQSRIGGTPWEFPQRYWQNSPVFYADRVNTPVLILHNDHDGAVPWTNGLEFFMALRRLGKEAYLFNYNGEPHGLRKAQNKKDWTRRMAQFFDHHLRGKPAPEWMTKGVRYVDREREKVRYARSYIERESRRAAAAASASSAPPSQSGRR